MPPSGTSLCLYGFEHSPAWQTMVLLLLSGGLLWLCTRTTRLREAFRIVTSAPAFLVPASMATIATAIFVGQGRHHLTVYESPFDYGSAVPFVTTFRFSLPGNLIVIAIVGVAIAGHLGLLEAHARKQKPSSAAFLRGIRKHAATILLGKIVLGCGVFAIWRVFQPSEAGLILFIVPSLFLAPLVGQASIHPGRPLRALRRTFQFTSEHMFAVGRFVTWQTLFAFGLMFLGFRTQGWSGEIPGEILCFGTSSLSFNAFPYAHFPLDNPVALTLMVLLSALASTVFMTGHWLGVTEGYSPARPPGSRRISVAPRDQFGEGYEYERH